nr:MFS transporter [Lachnospiraceae bacterium]
MTQTSIDSKTNNKTNYTAILIIYCLGLLIGGLFVGMIAPVRTVIQLDFGLDDSTGIWMINIYTLFYAALIPIIGKIADRYGRNRVFSICILIFMAGALICGISSKIGHFPLLLIGRVIQASGAGGM